MKLANLIKRGYSLKDLLDTPKYNDLIYDVGLHRGEDSEFYLRKGFRVVAFEADPEHIEHCKHRLRHFIDNGRLSIIEGAIVPSDSNLKKVRFYKNRDISVWGTIRPEMVERNRRLGTSSYVIEVDAVDFVEAIKRHGVPYYLKIDIEGADMICVNALKKFKLRPDYISVESDKTSFWKIRNELRLLVELGYDAFQAIEQAGIARSQVPPFPAREGNYIEHRFESGSSGLFGKELGGKWKTYREVLLHYFFIRLCYYLEGDDGIFKGWESPLGVRVRSVSFRILHRILKAEMPGWYDTHARHSSVSREL